MYLSTTARHAVTETATDAPDFPEAAGDLTTEQPAPVGETFPYLPLDQWRVHRGWPAGCVKSRHFADDVAVARE